jgi:hypothetical protein
MHEAAETPIGSVRGLAVAHFKVDAQGCYSLNGRRVLLRGVKRECARLARIGGAVLYYRENPTKDPPPEAEALIAAVSEARLPASFARRDYDPGVKVSDYFFPPGAW